MYSPISDGIDKATKAVQFNTMPAPIELGLLVDNYWELKTDAPLEDDFILHALPDACVNILFNQTDRTICGVTALRTTYAELNLGKQFHYIGIQFLPGAWQGNLADTSDSFVGMPYCGSLPLLETNSKLASLAFADINPILSALVGQLANDNIVRHNVVTTKILANIDNIQSVADMAAVTSYSARQLQRVLKKSTGFSPHDFLKVIRLQQSFRQHYLDYYADQPHFIHSFQKITGYTPADYYRKFNV